MTADRADPQPPGRTIRVMTYNVHRCEGTDGQVLPSRIASVIARHRPDIVTLQEIDVGRPRSGGVDQAHALATALEMDFHFFPALRIEEEQYGDAILTALPFRLVHAGRLPGFRVLPGFEIRGALWIAVDLGGVELQVVTTHLGVLAAEQKMQVAALLGDEWLGSPRCRGPLVFTGDLNAVSATRPYRMLAARLRDAHARPRRRTFPSWRPLIRIDHVFVSPEIEVLEVKVPRGPTERVASDHLPVIATLRIPEGRPAD
jgi:endonuclease/exonuclease/phosphatase family metal-dependent hydrolase